MLVEYSSLKFGYQGDGWDKAFQDRDIDEYRMRVLISDEAITPAIKEIYKIIYQLKKEGRPVTMLDIGCGTGHQLSSISYLCDKAVGFDVSSAVIDNNKKLQSSVQFITGDALNHPQFGEKFNIILMAGVLYSIDPTRQTHCAIMQQAYNSLSDDGYFVFYHRGYLSVIKYLDVKIRNCLDKMRGVNKKDYYMCWFDDRYIKKLVEEVGFKVIRVRKSDFAFNLCNTVFKKIFTKNREVGWDSYNNLNFIGKLFYMHAGCFFPGLSARSSVFVLRKKL